MQEAADCDTPIPVGIRATTRGDQCAVVQRTFLAQRRGVVMGVTEDIPDFQRPLRQPRWRDHVIRVTGAGALSSQRHPDAAAHDRQRPLPAIPPAMIPGLAPGRCGVERGRRDCPGQPRFRVPDTPVGAQGRTVDGRRVALLGPRLQQRDQLASQTPKQRGPPRRQWRKAACPGTPRGTTAVLRQQGSHLLGDRIVWCKNVEQGRGRRESPNDHDDECLTKRPCRRCLHPAPCNG
jgi:hypothetical protein